MLLSINQHKFILEREPRPFLDTLAWTWCAEDFDGAPDSGDMRSGYAASLKDAICDIIDTLDLEEI